MYEDSKQNIQEANALFLFTIRNVDYVVKQLMVNTKLQNNFGDLYSCEYRRMVWVTKIFNPNYKIYFIL